MAGRRTRASVAHSTWPTPRRGVGLDELLGGWDADGVEAQADLPKAEAGEHERARELSAGPVRSDSMGSRQAGRKKAQLPKPVNATHVMCERALQTWTKRQRAENLSDKQGRPKLVNKACAQHIYRTLFCRLTPELSRPAAGWRTRASVA